MAMKLARRLNFNEKAAESTWLCTSSSILDNDGAQVFYFARQTRTYRKFLLLLQKVLATSLQTPRKEVASVSNLHRSHWHRAHLPLFSDLLTISRLRFTLFFLRRRAFIRSRCRIFKAEFTVQYRERSPSVSRGFCLKAIDKFKC